MILVAHSRGPRRPLFLKGDTWRRSASALASLPLGVVWFSFVVTGLVSGVALLVTVVGVPILLGTFALAHLAAEVERRRARMLGLQVSGEHRQPSRGPIAYARLAREAGERVTWKEIAYLLLALPAGVVAFSAVVSAWAIAFTCTTAPLWYWAVPHKADFLHSGNRLDTPIEWVGVVAVGIAFVFFAPLVVHAVTGLQAWMIRSLLGRSSEGGSGGAEPR